ncbi:hypothetical protein J4Q44_G00316270 [Coregonus suidteri]|uniref:Kazal-like domain-containing protein n=1 Tax=Coregonus suidteri TaxID=861788 RepID=A0AAN8KW35_9TELE
MVCLWTYRNRPMRSPRWCSLAFLLGVVSLGVGVGVIEGRPGKEEGFGLPPYRPVVRFRHKDGIPGSLRIKGFLGHNNGFQSPCEQKYCGLGRHCVVNHESGKGECNCLDHCKPHYKPVCGSDNKLYQNHCELHRASCLGAQRITVMHSEECFYKGKNYHS